MSYPGDDEFGYDHFREKIVDAIYQEGLGDRYENDTRFNDYLDDLFDIPSGNSKSSLSLDDIQDDYEAFADYLNDIYGLDLDYYWDWADWRAEYDAA